MNKMLAKQHRPLRTLLGHLERLSSSLGANSPEKADCFRVAVLVSMCPALRGTCLTTCPRRGGGRACAHWRLARSSPAAAGAHVRSCRRFRFPNVTLTGVLAAAWCPGDWVPQLLKKVGPRLRICGERKPAPPNTAPECEKYGHAQEA